MSIQSFEPQHSLTEFFISDLRKDNEVNIIDGNFDLASYISKIKYSSSSDVVGCINKVSALSKFIKDINLNDSISIEEDSDDNTKNAFEYEHNSFTLDISIDNSFDLSDKEYQLNLTIANDEHCKINGLNKLVNY